VNRTETLSESNWFVAQGNYDFWSMNDPRYLATQSDLLNLTQSRVSPSTIVTEVLHQPGVLMPITIFTASMSASLGLLDLYIIA